MGSDNAICYDPYDFEVDADPYPNTPWHRRRRPGAERRTPWIID